MPANGLSKLVQEKHRFTVETQGLSYSTKQQRSQADDDDAAWTDDESGRDNRARRTRSPPLAQKMASELSRLLHGGAADVTDDALERLLAGSLRSDADTAGYDAAKTYLKQVLGDLYGGSDTLASKPQSSLAAAGEIAGSGPGQGPGANGSQASGSAWALASALPWGHTSIGSGANADQVSMPGAVASAGPASVGLPSGARPPATGDRRMSDDGEPPKARDQPPRPRAPHHGNIRDQLGLLQNADQLAAIISVATTAATTAAAAAVKQTMQAPRPLPPGAFARMHAAAAATGSEREFLSAFGMHGRGITSLGPHPGPGGGGDAHRSHGSPEPQPQQRAGSRVVPHQRSTPLALQLAGVQGGTAREQLEEMGKPALQPVARPPWLPRPAVPLRQVQNPGQAGGDGGVGGAGQGANGSNSAMRVVRLGAPRVTARTPTAAPPPQREQEGRLGAGGGEGDAQKPRPVPFPGWGADGAAGQADGAGDRSPTSRVSPSSPSSPLEEKAGRHLAGVRQPGRLAAQAEMGGGASRDPAAGAARTAAGVAAAWGAAAEKLQRASYHNPPTPVLPSERVLEGRVPADGLYVTGGRSLFAAAGLAPMVPNKDQPGQAAASGDGGGGGVAGDVSKNMAPARRRAELPPDVADAFRSTLAFLADPDAARAAAVQQAGAQETPAGGPDHRAVQPPAWQALADVETRKEAEREAEELLGGPFDYAAAKRELEQARRSSRLLRGGPTVPIAATAAASTGAPRPGGAFVGGAGAGRLDGRKGAAPGQAVAAGPTGAGVAPPAAAMQRGDFAGVLPPPHSAWEVDEAWNDIDEYTKAIEAEVAYRAAQPLDARRASPRPKPGSMAAGGTVHTTVAVRASQATALLALKAQGHARSVVPASGQETAGAGGAVSKTAPQSAAPAGSSAQAGAEARKRRPSPRPTTGSPGRSAPVDASPSLSPSPSPPRVARKQQAAGPARVAFGRRVEEPLKPPQGSGGGRGRARSSSPPKRRTSPSGAASRAAGRRSKGRAGAVLSASISTNDAVHEVLSALASVLMSEGGVGGEEEDPELDEPPSRTAAAAAAAAPTRHEETHPLAPVQEDEAGNAASAAGPPLVPASLPAMATEWPAVSRPTGKAAVGAGARSAQGALPVPQRRAAAGHGLEAHGGPEAAMPAVLATPAASPGPGARGPAAMPPTGATPWMQPAVQPWPATTATARPRFQYVIDTAHPPVTRLPAWAASAAKAPGAPAAYAAVMGAAPSGIAGDPAVATPTRAVPASAAGAPMAAAAAAVRAGWPAAAADAPPALGTDPNQPMPGSKLPYAQQVRQQPQQQRNQPASTFSAPAYVGGMTHILPPPAAAAAMAAAVAHAAGAGNRGARQRGVGGGSEAWEHALLQAVEDEIVSRVAVAQLAARDATIAKPELQAALPPLVDSALCQRLVMDVLHEQLVGLMRAGPSQGLATGGHQEAGPDPDQSLKDLVAALAAATSSSQTANMQQREQQPPPPHEQQALPAEELQPKELVQQYGAWSRGGVAAADSGQTALGWPTAGEPSASGGGGRSNEFAPVAERSVEGRPALLGEVSASSLLLDANDSRTRDTGRGAGAASGTSSASGATYGDAPSPLPEALPASAAGPPPYALMGARQDTADSFPPQPPRNTLQQQQQQQLHAQQGDDYGPVRVPASSPSLLSIIPGELASLPATKSDALALQGGSQPPAVLARQVALQAAGVQTRGTQATGVQAAGTQAAGVQAAGTQAYGVQERATQAAGVQDRSAQADPPPPHYMLQAALAAGLPYGPAAPAAATAPDGLPPPFSFAPAGGGPLALPLSNYGLYGGASAAAATNADALYGRPQAGRQPLKLPGLSKLRDSSDVESSSDSVQRHLQAPGQLARATGTAGRGRGAAVAASSIDSDDGLLQRSYAPLDLSSLTARPLRLGQHRAVAEPEQQGGATLGPSAPAPAALPTLNRQAGWEGSAAGSAGVGRWQGDGDGDGALSGAGSSQAGSERRTPPPAAAGAVAPTASQPAAPGASRAASVAAYMQPSREGSGVSSIGSGLGTGVRAEGRGFVPATGVLAPSQLSASERGESLGCSGSASVVSIPAEPAARASVAAVNDARSTSAPPSAAAGSHAASVAGSGELLAVPELAAPAVADDEYVDGGFEEDQVDYLDSDDLGDVVRSIDPEGLETSDSAAAHGMAYEDSEVRASSGGTDTGVDEMPDAAAGSRADSRSGSRAGSEGGTSAVPSRVGARTGTGANASVAGDTAFDGEGAPGGTGADAMAPAMLLVEEHGEEDNDTELEVRMEAQSEGQSGDEEGDAGDLDDAEVRRVLDEEDAEEDEASALSDDPSENEEEGAPANEAPRDGSADSSRESSQSPDAAEHPPRVPSSTPSVASERHGGLAVAISFGSGAEDNGGLSAPENGPRNTGAGSTGGAAPQAHPNQAGAAVTTGSTHSAAASAAAAGGSRRSLVAASHDSSDGVIEPYDEDPLRSSLERMARAGLLPLEKPRPTAAPAHAGVGTVIRAGVAGTGVAPMEPMAGLGGNARPAPARPVVAPLQPAGAAGAMYTARPTSPGQPPSLTDYEGPMGRLWRPPAAAPRDPLSSSSETLMASSEASAPPLNAVSRAALAAERAAAGASSVESFGSDHHAVAALRAAARAHQAAAAAAAGRDSVDDSLAGSSLDLSASVESGGASAASGLTPPRPPRAAAQQGAWAARQAPGGAREARGRQAAAAPGGRDGSMFRLRQYGARRRKLMQQIGIRDPLLSSATSLSTDSTTDFEEEDDGR